jgi:hypothetical protein
MKNYLIVGHSNDITATGTLEEWKTYYSEVVGEALVDGGNPVASKTVVRGGNASDATDDTVVGYYIIKAESRDAAIAMVKQSPMANNDGCEARVYELAQM